MAKAYAVKDNVAIPATVKENDNEREGLLLVDEGSAFKYDKDNDGTIDHTAKTVQNAVHLSDKSVRIGEEQSVSIGSSVLKDKSFVKISDKDYQHLQDTAGSEEYKKAFKGAINHARSREGASR